MIWQYEYKGVYSYSSHYVIVNFSGIEPEFVPAVWKLHVPPRVHIFLWLLAQNKFMTRVNLKKRKFLNLKNLYNISSSNALLLNKFGKIALFFHVDLSQGFLFIAKFWLANKIYAVLNYVCACALWSLWKTRYGLISDAQTWLGLTQVWRLILNSLKNWEHQDTAACNYLARNTWRLLIERLT